MSSGELTQSVFDALENQPQPFRFGFFFSTRLSPLPPQISHQDRHTLHKDNFKYQGCSVGMFRGGGLSPGQIRYGGVSMGRFLRSSSGPDTLLNDNLR